MFENSESTKLVYTYPIHRHPHSIALVNEGRSFFEFNRIQLGRATHVTLGKGSSDNMYVIMEINLKTRFISFVGPAMYVNVSCMLICFFCVGF